MSIEKPQNNQELSLIAKAMKYNDEVQAIFEEMEDKIGDVLRGMYMADKPLDADIKKIEPELKAGAERLSSIGELQVSPEELQELLSKKLGLRELA